MERWRSVGIVFTTFLLAVCVAKSTFTVARGELLSTAQVRVLNGSAGALTLTYCLTGAAELHYAVVLSGREALVAEDVKAAATGNASAMNIAVSSTISSMIAKRLRWNVLDLQPNTSYDVYFVAEVINSNGVFGTVISVNGTRTHPKAPVVSVYDSWPQRASTTKAAIDISLSFPGVFHYVVVPIEASKNLSSLDIWSNATGTTQSFSVHSSNHTFVNITDLSSFTTYDVWYVAEVFASGGVLGAVGQIEKAFTTFSIAPKLTDVVCGPQDGSTTVVNLQFTLEFPPQAFEKYNLLQSRQSLEYYLHFVASNNNTVFTTGGDIKSAGNASTIQQAGKYLLSLPEASTDTAQLAHATATSMNYVVNITSLGVGQSYLLYAIIETRRSDGVYSNLVASSEFKTHAHAPKVSAVRLHAQNTTTDTLVATVTLEHAADIHLFLATTDALRSVPQGEQQQLMPLITTYNASFNHTIIRANTTGNESYTITYPLTDLDASTAYGLIVFSETIESNGVFSSRFAVVEARTNIPAGEVQILDSVPVLGSTSQLQIKVNRMQPRDMLMMCYSELSPESLPFEATVNNCYQHDGPPTVVTLSNLTANTLYNITIYAQTAEGVQSTHVNLPPLATHDEAPSVNKLHLDYQNGSASTLVGLIALDTPGFVHYVIAPSSEVDGWKSPINSSVLSHSKHLVEYFGAKALNLTLTGLIANTTYSLVVLPEAAYGTNHTGVYGTIEMINLTTFSLAPKILHSVVEPLNATTDEIFFTVNISFPGRVHYMVSDLDFEDPNVLKTSEIVQPLVRRGYFDIVEPVMEARNETIDGVNVTKWHPLQVYRNNHSVAFLESDRMYHVYFTTETFNSYGVYGGLPPPHVVTTHAKAPIFENLIVESSAAKSDEIEISFCLSRYGNVHYILVHRGATVAMDLRTVIPENETTPISTLDLTTLQPLDIKTATIERLGLGVVENGSISVSREDWVKGSSKQFKKLAPGTLYDVCLVPETDASEGVFDSITCNSVTTHAEYSNLTLLADIISVTPLPGTTDCIVLRWEMLCVEQCNRIPRYILVSESFGGRPEYQYNGFERDIPFNKVNHGKNGVVAVGEMVEVSTRQVSGNFSSNYTIPQNARMVQFEATLTDLLPHHKYFTFFAAETIGSRGLFSKVNANANESVKVFDVRTHALPPLLPSYYARPTYGNTTGIDVVVDVNCASVKCPGVILHTLVTSSGCSYLNPRCILLNKSHEVDIPHNHELKGHVIYLENALLLSPNTTYDVFIATETLNSQGVMSRYFATSVTTHPPAPHFTLFSAKPKSASTTELVLTFELNARGVIHYMIADDTQDVHVSSVYNVSAKKAPGSNEDWHKYGYERVKWRRSSPATTKHSEVVQQLVQNANYTIYAVVETDGDAGIYGSTQSIQNVSTFAHAPLLLFHEAHPTPASTNHLRLSYKLNSPGIVHCLVTMASQWQPTLSEIAFGNVIGKDITIVNQKSLLGDQNTIDLDVPLANQSYTVLLVTETTESQGVFGTIATMNDIKSSDVAPIVQNVSITATDARNDALNITIDLNTVGIIHYSYAEKNHELNMENVHTYTINYVTNLSAKILLEGLKEGTIYDLYLQTETLASQGVLGPLLKFDGTIATHGPPPLIIEEVDCTMAPASCESLGREQCWSVANTCGECLEGYHGDQGAANTPCTATQPDAKPRKAKKSIGIKISGVKTSYSETKPIEVDISHQETCPENSHYSLETSKCQCNDGYIMDNGSCVRLCPSNSFMSAPGQCRCERGFVLNALQTSCVPESTVNVGFTMNS
ncbi:hypothetical protein THRCLA_01773 [Thraustotheca clavata]|uniref:Fibronectin type-III domain-containing protein n=1 Tax=Thraustotheca clavata TaxID=74557 RepID=A0A1W0A7K0_9STRA|nr:hypothetical protein THRCLA_01773 [Thraustotheca clavata]